MKKLFFVCICLFFLLLVVFSQSFGQEKDSPGENSTKKISQTSIKVTPIPTEEPTKLPDAYTIPSKSFVSQTFNNCGPATLSMILSYSGINVSQIELGQIMRPYQNPVGDNDDKSVSVKEFVSQAKEYNVNSLERPNGSIEILKELVSNDIPVVVRTWLHPNEDIGHFRVVRGYDDTTRTLIQDDSYEGPNLTYDYDTFLSMWQPFNYGYILVYPPAKQDIVEKILGEDFDQTSAYRNSIKRAEKELQNNPDSIYSRFNLSTAYYYLDDQKRSVEEFEKVQHQLPSRMLWYQIEPIRAYEAAGNKDRVFTFSDMILSNNNRAFSELYMLKGKILEKEGNKEAAKIEYEQAMFYNVNYQDAKDAFDNLTST